jgi:hypothetical protein
MPPSSGQNYQPNGKNGTDRSTVCLVWSSERIDRRAKWTREEGYWPIIGSLLKDRVQISYSEFVPALRRGLEMPEWTLPDYEYMIRTR